MKKKLLGIALSLASLGVVGMASEAKAAPSTSSTTIEASANPQWQWQRDRYGRSTYNRRRTRTVRQSRVVRFGRRLYRETFLVAYFPNGRTDTRLISRVRIS